MTKQLLEKLAGGHDLTADEIDRVLEQVIEGTCPAPVIGGLLMALRIKGETKTELAAAAAVFRRRALSLPLDRPAQLCTAGTGGDGRGTLNLSTAAALIAAAAGVTVAKHGNRAISSDCGSADLLEAMGMDIQASPEASAAVYARTNFCFLMAPQYHPAMAAVRPIRQALGVRTLFNLLGPLTNPAGVNSQLIGVFHPSRAQLLAEAAALGGAKRVLVVAADCGMDEVAPEGATHMVELIDGKLSSRTVTPEDFGLQPAPLDSIAGGDPAHNAQVIGAVLDGASHPARTGVLLNAAAALYVAGAADSLQSAKDLAVATIEEGRVRTMLNNLSATERRAA